MSWFKPRVMLLIGIGILGVTVLCALGFWQLSRATYKATLEKQFHEASQHRLSAQALLQLPHPQEKRFYPARFQSELADHHTLLLDNQIYQGRAGYDVFVPAKLATKNPGEAIWILVNRGWIPLGANRQQRPHLAPVTGKKIIEGYLDFAYRNPLIREIPEEEGDDWPLRVQQIDLNKLSNRLNVTLFPMILVLAQDHPDALTVRPRTTTLNAARHRGYAVQWFGLAFAFAIWFLYVCRSAYLPRLTGRIQNGFLGMNRKTWANKTKQK